MSKYHIVITSINPPNEAMLALRDGCQKNDGKFWIIGDTKSPSEFSLHGAEYLNIESQLESGFLYARIVPTRHYARKNIGYLCAIRENAEVILETDDDNLPLSGFWEGRPKKVFAKLATEKGWGNVYRYFSDVNIWPRGFPLPHLKDKIESYSSLSSEEKICPIQQGLVDENPDVDAIYRLVLPLPIKFKKNRAIMLDKGVWCPFNSQNTVWWKEAFPLLYLPYYCSFRMTDIWRSLIAQRILWENGWHLLFHSSTMWQDRNEHDLLRDFEDEVVGYINNGKIADTLTRLSLNPGISEIPGNIVKCYEALIGIGMIGEKEITLLHAWLDDLSGIQ
jgi:hypothetical protein